MICGLNVDCLLVDLTSYKFGSDFSKKLVKFLLEALRLNDNRFVRHTSKFVKIAICQLFRTFGRCVFAKAILYGLKGGGHNIFKATNLLTNWLKIPKSVIVTGFPLSSFKYLMYLAELCCDSKDVFLVDGRSWLRSCHLAVDMVGVVGTFSLP